MAGPISAVSMAGEGEGVARVVGGVVQQLRLGEADTEQHENAEK
jgi:hypothetical protein